MIAFIELALFFLSTPLLEIFSLVCLGEDNRLQTAKIVKLTTRGVFLLQVVLFFVVVCQGKNFVSFGLRFDALSTVMLLLIALINLLVQHFSIEYMKVEKSYNSYFIDLSVFVLLLMLFVVADNLFFMTLGWVGMSLSLFRLLRTQKNFLPAQASSKLALKTFLIGDAFFILAVICLNSLDIHSVSDLLSGAGTLSHSVLYRFAGWFFVVSALTKTANVPFYKWLPNTMIAPTPVSAIMHAGFVNSGGFLLARLSTYYLHYPQPLTFVLIIGLATAVFGSLAMLVQSDVKRYLAFSTIGQMGFMIMQCGFGSFTSAIFHLIAHSLFKSSLFLGSGSVIQKSEDAFNVSSIAAVKGSAKAPFSLVIFTLILISTWLFSQDHHLSFFIIFPLITTCQFAIAILSSTHSLLTKSIISLLLILSIPLTYIMLEDRLAVLLQNAVINIQHSSVLFSVIPAIFTALLFSLFVLSDNRLIHTPRKWRDWVYVWLLNRASSTGGLSTYTHRLIN